MRVLKGNDRPVVGSEVQVVFQGKVTKSGADGLFRVTNEHGHEMFFSQSHRYSNPEIREITPAPREWVTGAIYTNGESDYYLRREAGWKSVQDGDLFEDGSIYLSQGFLDKLKIMEVKK